MRVNTGGMCWTTSTGTEKSGGMLVTRSANALGPPVDAATTTRLTGPSGRRSGGGVGTPGRATGGTAVPPSAWRRPRPSSFNFGSS